LDKQEEYTPKIPSICAKNPEKIALNWQLPLIPNATPPTAHISTVDGYKASHPNIFASAGAPFHQREYTINKISFIWPNGMATSRSISTHITDMA